MSNDPISDHEAEEHYEKRAEKVSKAWSTDEWLGRTDGPKLAWLCSDTLKRLADERVSGDPGVTFHEWIVKERLGRRFDRALSVGCTTGVNEIVLYDLGLCREFTGVDISAAAIDSAEERRGNRNMRFMVMDLEKESLSHEPFDIIFCFSVLHHINNLGFFLKNLHASLAEGGILVVHDYVGASRFQWPKNTMDIMNDAYAVLPAAYHYNFASKGQMPWIIRPPIISMVVNDPSEAVRSGEIEALLEVGFDRSDEVFLFSPILLYLFYGIIEHFDEAKPMDVAFLNLCGQLEERLVREGVIGRGGVVSFYSKRESGDVESVYESEGACGRQVFEGEKRLLGINGKLEDVARATMELLPRLEQSKRAYSETIDSINSVKARASLRQTGLKWQSARAGIRFARKVRGHPRRDAHAAESTADTPSPPPPASEFGTAEGKAILRRIRGEEPVRGPAWQYLLTDREVLPGGTWLLYCPSDNQGPDAALYAPDVAFTALEADDRCDCIIVDAERELPEGLLARLTTDGCLVSVAAQQGSATAVGEFIAEMMQILPPWCLRGVVFEEHMMPRSRPNVTPALPLRRVLRLGRVVDTALSERFLEALPEDEMAGSVLGLLMLAECSYVEAGFDLPRYEVSIFSSSDRWAQRADPIAGIEYDTIALQSYEEQRLTSLLELKQAELEHLTRLEASYLDANHRASEVLAFCDTRSKRLFSGKLVPYTLLRLKQRGLPGV